MSRLKHFKILSGLYYNIGRSANKNENYLFLANNITVVNGPSLGLDMK